MKKSFIILSLMLLGCAAFAQDVYNSSGRLKPRKEQQENGFSTDNLIFGGGLGLSFGQITNIYLAPTIGYKFNDKLAAGVSLGYNYFRWKDFYTYNNFNPPYNPETYSITQNYYSVSLWARYIIWENVFIHLEPEMDYYDYYDGSYSIDQNSGTILMHRKKVIAPCLLAGAGFRQPLSDRTSFTITALYDVLQDKYSPYLNRLDVRFGILVGF